MHSVLSVVCEELVCCCCAPSTSNSNHKMSQHTYTCTCTYGGYFFRSQPQNHARPTRNIEKKRCGLSCLHCSFSFFSFWLPSRGMEHKEPWKATSKRSHYKKKKNGACLLKFDRRGSAERIIPGTQFLILTRPRSP